MRKGLCLLAVSVAGGVLTLAGVAAADSPRLRGSYGFTGTGTCLIAPGHVGTIGGPSLPNPTPGTALSDSGFRPNLQPIDAVPGSTSQAFLNSFSVEGIRKFNGNGTGTVKGTSVGVTSRPTPGPGGFPSFPAAAGSADFSFAFTYTVAPDGTWTATMTPGSYTETFTTGPRAGQTGTMDALPPVVGMMSEDRQTLIAAHITPTVETHKYSNGDVWPMICDRSRVFIKLNDDHFDNDHDGHHDHHDRR